MDCPLEIAHHRATQIGHFIKNITDDTTEKKPQDYIDVGYHLIALMTKTFANELEIISQQQPQPTADVIADIAQWYRGYGENLYTIIGATP